MSNRFTPATTLTIDSREYRVCEHPSAPGQPYGQVGREAIVYKVTSGDQAFALKVFKRSFRTPDLVGVSARLRPLSDVSGLKVAERTVLDPIRFGPLIERYPDLLYAVVMPWIEGPTWFDLVLKRHPFNSVQSQSYARSLVGILARLEDRRFAHSDLSAANLVLAGMVGADCLIELVDIDQFYSPFADRPTAVAPGSPGYAMANHADAMWSPARDRFAGAVLLAEMLTWSSPGVREAARLESCFDPAEMQQDCHRYRLVRDTLVGDCGQAAADLFATAWFSRSLDDCPTFARWQTVLPWPSPPPSEPTDHEAAVRALIKVAERLRERGDVAGARRTLEQAQVRVAANSVPGREVAGLLQALNAAPPRPVSPPAPPTSPGPTVKGPPTPGATCKGAALLLVGLALLILFIVVVAAVVAATSH
jgi:hypothetical protein